jgi:hypothetical protein
MPCFVVVVGVCCPMLLFALLLCVPLFCLLCICAGLFPFLSHYVLSSALCLVAAPPVLVLQTFFLGVLMWVWGCGFVVAFPMMSFDLLLVAAHALLVPIRSVAVMTAFLFVGSAWHTFVLAAGVVVFVVFI